MRHLYLLFAVAMLLAMSATASAQGRSVTVRLQATHHSGIHGTATLTDNGNGTTTVTIHMQGAPENAVEPVMVHHGTCKGTPTTIVYPLNDIVTGNSRTVVRASIQTLTSKSGHLFINVHRSHQDLKDVVACGPLGPPYALPSTGAGGLSQSGNHVPAAGASLIAVLAAACILVWKRRTA